MKVQNNISLAGLTTLGVGGPARFFVEAASEADIRAALDLATRESLPLLVLGGGSNLLVADEGFPGVVLHVSLKGIDVLGGAGGLVEAAAGEDWDGLVAFAVERGMAGIECLSGIPGTVGGTPVQNVGAYGQEVRNILLEVRALDRESGEVRALSRDECRFGYRSSRFNTDEAGRHIVLGVTFELRRGVGPCLEYRDVREFFAGRAAAPTLAEVRAAVQEIRRRKAMLLVPGDPDCRSAGSFFKNPVVSEARYRAIAEAAAGAAAGAPGAAPPTGPPRYPAEPGLVKTSAAWLIERAGFRRGYARGRAAISTKHTLALVNLGGATAAEILALAGEIRDGGEKQFGLRLEPEPVMLGD